MLGLLEVPRIRLKNYDIAYEIDVPGLQEKIPKGAYSFIIDRFPLPKVGYKIEAYPYTNEEGNKEEIIVYNGGFTECMKMMNDIARILKMQDILFDADMLNRTTPPKSIKYPYVYNERVRSIYDEH